jgi:hypothetical protein
MPGLRQLFHSKNDALVGGRERRRSHRHLVTSSSTVRCADSDHIGFIRDISRHGLFVYSDFVPAIGEVIQVAIGEDAKIPLRLLRFTGVVVRVDAPSIGTPIGIGLRISGCVPQLRGDEFWLS